MDFCRDCKHVERDETTGAMVASPKCLHPKCELNPVTGEHRYAAAMRCTLTQGCTLDGLWFEPLHAAGDASLSEQPQHDEGGEGGGA